MCDKMNHFYPFVPLFTYPADKVTKTCLFFESDWWWTWEQQNLYIESKRTQGFVPSGAKKALKKAFLNNIFISFLHPSK